ncbi:MAG: LytTR family DNA-binding domain-containing protein [Verrucomicrobiota bacterium]|jgi:two-component system LytT family response regulator
MKIRAIIVDDEPLAREGIKTFLAEEPDVEVVGECADGASAVRAVEERRPDLLFLDVQMPRLNGFDVLEAIAPELVPLVIFTTAHDEHAIRAFDVNALDYLLKPFKQARFKAALQRAREQLAARSGGAADPRLASLLDGLRAPTRGVPRILVKSPDHILFLKAEEIDHIEAAGNYLVLHAGKDRHIVRETMAAMEAKLGPAGFMRISRSAMVNLNRIGQLEPLLAPGEFCVILKSGARLNMTCSLSELQRRMGAA